MDPQLQAGNATYSVPDGFDRQGRWVGSEAHGRTAAQQAGAWSAASGELFGTAPGSVRGAGGSEFRLSPPLPDYDAAHSSPRSWLSPRMVVTLLPAEIRTFEITVRRKMPFARPR